MVKTDDARVYGGRGRMRHGCVAGRNRFGRGGMWREDAEIADAREEGSPPGAPSPVRMPSEVTALLIERDRLRGRLDDVEAALKAQGEEL